MSEHETKDDLKEGPRRNFLLEFWSVLIGGIVGLFPFLAGVALLLDPLRRSAAKADFVRVASLDAIPPDGVPRQFPVIKDRTDAWTFSPNERVGAVFLRRQPESDTVEALNVVCPHAGCFLGYDAATDAFQCPCHASAFKLDGAVIRPTPSPRDMDQLEAKVEDGFVHVAFVNYQPGKHEKVAK
jgi:Rieske Fe-S protein